MSIPGEVQQAPAGAKGFDSDTRLTLELAQQFLAQDYSFCLRYVSLGAEQSGDLTADEVEQILQGGLALMPVQHVRMIGWSPTEELGQSTGADAGSNAEAVGFPAGVCVWCDLEGINESASVQKVIAYCNAWYEAVAEAGFVPGLYVGRKCVLSSEQLYQNLKFSHYWKSASTVPEVAVRGYQMIQTLEEDLVNEIGIDKDATQTDQLGGTAIWLAPLRSA